MRIYRLTTIVIALKNLEKRSFRTKSIIAIVSVLAFAIFCGLLLSQSISLGKNYLSGRMGADIMVVPRGYALNLQDTLLRSRSNTFYMKENLTDKISEIPSIEQVSPQLYVGSLNASCCTVPVQLIGFDPKTDFTIKSWMSNIDSSKLGFGEVVTGSRVNATVGGEVWFFGSPFKVAGTIANTGMGFDSSVFMSLETAKHMIELSQKSAVHPAGTTNDQISALFVKLKNGSDASNVAQTLVSTYPQTDVVVLEDMIQVISKQLSNIKGLVYGIQMMLWIISVLVLVATFNVTTNERKHEFGLFLALGATRKKLESILITETLITSIAGSILGVMFGCLIMFEFLMLIATSLGLPYIQPTIGSTIKLAVISILIPVFTGLIASIHSVVLISRLETNVLIREYK